MVRRLTSLRSRAFSSRISVVVPSRSPRSMRSWRTQLPSVCSTTPSSRATSAIVRCWSMTRDAASRRNSFGYLPRRLVGSGYSRHRWHDYLLFEVSGQRGDGHFVFGDKPISPRVLPFSKHHSRGLTRCSTRAALGAQSHGDGAHPLRIQSQGSPLRRKNPFNHLNLIQGNPGTVREAASAPQSDCRSVTDNRKDW